MDKIAVLIPCYNEEQTIGRVVRSFQESLPEATIYVYDNNSTDRTAEIARQAGAVVRPEYQQGKGNVIRSMFHDIDAECYLMTDGDDTYPAGQAREMVDGVLVKGADMVIGDRLSSSYFQENKRPLHNEGNRLVRGLINFLFDSQIRDIMTGYRAFSYEFVKSFPVISEGFEIETEMTIFALDKKLHIENVIIDYRDRPEGSRSKLNTFSDGWRVLKTIARLFRNYKPLYFFGVLAVIIFLVALVLFLSVWSDFQRTGLVRRFPTLIGAGFLGITAMILFGVGLILEVFAQQNRQQFEENYKEIGILKEMRKKHDHD